jgi:hypothetical protein
MSFNTKNAFYTPFLSVNFFYVTGLGL